MTNEEILKKAIEKAVKNGWKDFDGKGSYLDKDLLSQIIIGMWHIYQIIFSHSFAKAFWGDIDVYQPIKTNLCTKCSKKYTKELVYKKLPRWKYELQQMVLEEEPLKYLEKFLNKEK